METKQLNGYKIDFFETEPTCHIHPESDCVWWLEEIDEGDGLIGYCDFEDAMKNNLCVFAGKVSEIKEELAEIIVEKYFNHFRGRFYHNYRLEKQDFFRMFETAKQSFQTLSELKYCVVTKSE